MSTKFRSNAKPADPSAEKQNPLAEPEVSLWQGLAFTAPSLGLVFLMGPMGVIQGIYAKHFGLALTSLAAVLLVSRLFDAIIDPLIGHFSDRARARSGTRKPYILAGCLGLIPCSYFLYVPPEGVTVAYFAFWSFAFYTASTLYGIPNFAWASEMTSDPKSRTRLFTLLLVVGQVGGALFFLVPFLPMFETSEITPETLKVSVLFGVALIIPGVFLALKFVPSGRAPELSEDVTPAPHNQVVKDTIVAIKANRPFRLFVGAYMCVGLGLGMWGGLFFIYVDSFLGLGEEFAKIALFGIGGGLLITPVCYKMAVTIGKRNTWLFSSVVILIGVAYTGVLQPGSAGFRDLLILQIILTLGGISGGVIAPAMLSDVVDYGRLQDASERNGSYFSVFSFLVKAQAALGAALGLAVAGWFGFDATATEQTEQSIFGMRMAITWMPLGIASTGLVFIWLTPLNKRRNALIRKRLLARAERQAQAAT